MSTPNHRVLLSFDAGRKVFFARAPELGPCVGEGSTRAEALAQLELELTALVKNVAERGGRLPTAVDEETVTGELHIKVSQALHRELLWLARSEGVEPGQVAAEILAAGLSQRRRSGTGRGGSSDGNQRSGGPRGSDGGPGHSGRYQPSVMDDRAAFIEHVRSQEGATKPAGGGRPRSAPSAGDGRRGPGGKTGPGRTDQRGRGGGGAGGAAR